MTASTTSDERATSMWNDSESEDDRRSRGRPRSERDAERDRHHANVAPPDGALGLASTARRVIADLEEGVSPRASEAEASARVEAHMGARCVAEHQCAMAVVDAEPANEVRRDAHGGRNARDEV